MDKERLQLAKTLSDQIGRLEDALRSARMDVPGLGRSLPSHPVITALTPAALARVRAVMEEDLQEQLEKANKAFEAL